MSFYVLIVLVKLLGFGVGGFLGILGFSGNLVLIWFFWSCFSLKCEEFCIVMLVYVLGGGLRLCFLGMDLYFFSLVYVGKEEEFLLFFLLIIDIRCLFIFFDFSSFISLYVFEVSVIM